MPNPYAIPVWKQAPFVRLLLPLVTGIVLQWYGCFTVVIPIILSCLALLSVMSINLLPPARHYKWRSIQGLMLSVLITLIGMLLTFRQDTRNEKNWFGHFYKDSMALCVSIAEPLLKKEKSYKAEATVEQVIDKGIQRKVCGKLLLYFSKDDSASLPVYGDKIIIPGNLRRIKNSGNPGAFDYERYAGFQQIFHQSFLKKDNYVLLPLHREKILYRFIFSAREKIINTLQQYIKGSKKVTGIAEALLIGYKEDLDMDTVQDYSNTGVVHIIAISGMHLGLIYVVLLWIFARLPGIKKSKFLQVFLILTCLWLFSLVTGGSASVLRSAVMFTCIAIGKNFFRQASVYNSLATSAFLLLCYNPYLLWDTGFQLSYLAVAGIVWLQKPIINILYVKNNFLRKVWEMSSVTVAAQIITFPVCIFYFHRFPNLFLPANLLCVPLSTVILFTEIFLLLFSALPPVAILTGRLIYVLTWLMNSIIGLVSRMPFSLTDGIYSTVLSTLLLYAAILCICGWLMYKNHAALKAGIISLLLFSGVCTYHKLKHYHKSKIVVYNVPHHTAIDFIARGKYWFFGDTVLTAENALQNFHLKPARISMQVTPGHDTLSGIRHSGKLWQFGNKRFLLIDSTLAYEPAEQKLPVDFIFISRSPKIKIADLISAVSPAIIVFDSSNSLWKIGQWKKECSALHLRCHTVSEDGAFILTAD